MEWLRYYGKHTKWFIIFLENFNFKVFLENNGTVETMTRSYFIPETQGDDYTFDRAKLYCKRNTQTACSKPERCTNIYTNQIQLYF